MSFSELQAYIGSLFSPAQQFAFLIITTGVMSLTQVFKNTFFAFYPTSRPKKKAIIWLFAFNSGLLGGVSGYFTGMSEQKLWFWIFTGIVSGIASIGAFKFLVEIVWFKWLLRKKTA